MTNQEADSWSEANQTALAYTWAEYRVWAATSRRLRSELFSWRLRVLALTVAAAVLGVLAADLARAGPGDSTLSWLPGALSLLSGASLALAAYFSREILSPELERRWVRSRSLAEALKSETYLFRAGVPPYDTPQAATALIEKTQELLTQAQDLPAVSLTDEQRRARLPSGGLDPAAYLDERVYDQINNFYRPRAVEYEGVISRTRQLTLALGVLAALFGLFSSLEWAAGWVAVFATASASLAAYLYAGRYQSLLISYQATAAQLEALKTQWLVQAPAGGGMPPSREQRARFIQACEDAISVENSAWMARWLKAAA